MSEYDNSESKARWREYVEPDCLDVDDEPEVKNSWGKYGGYELVGNGVVTNSNLNDRLACGKFYGFKGCVHTEWHDHVSLDGVNHCGMVYVKKRFHFCNNPRCPICYKRGWAVREAFNIQERVEGSSERFGQAEHIIASVPECDYGLSFEGLRKKAFNALMSRGVLGGVLIFHAFRYRSYYYSVRLRLPMGWYWSPHYHCIGFIKGGYGKCRGCSNSDGDGGIFSREKCLCCDGFEGLTRRQYDKDSFIVKVKAERKTICGTAWYQLNHSSIKPDVKRFHVATWFGVCSYRKLKLKKQDKMGVDAERCPICGAELVKLRYLGFDLERILSQFWIREFEEPAFEKESGNPIWVERESGSHRFSE